jgi:hypothetical protein
VPIERRPRNPVTRGRTVPNATTYRVRDGDSWVAVAARFQIDPKALIHANFETGVPAEVNWYLHHYVGCNRTTRDGRNWRFSGSASPGIIQIPPTTYDFPEDTIVGARPPRFFTVTTRPEDWVAPADGPAGSYAGFDVVTWAPWKHTNLSIGGVRVQTRTEWAAGDPIWANEVVYYNTAYSLASIYSTIVIHHTNNSDSIRTNEQREQGRKFAAIGYHFFIDKQGTVFEGRPLEVMGSHAGTGLTAGPLSDPDWGAVGIVLQGDYHHADDRLYSEDPPAAQLNKLKELLIALRSQLSGIRTLLMHKEVSRGGPATVCPGDALYGPIEALRKELGFGGP